MGEDYPNELTMVPVLDEFVQGLVDSEGWGWQTVDLSAEKQSLRTRFLSKVPFIGKHFAEIAEQTPTESEA